MAIASIATVLWTAVASIGSTVKSAVAAIAGEVAAAVLSWVFRDTPGNNTSYAEQIGPDLLVLANRTGSGAVRLTTVADPNTVLFSGSMPSANYSSLVVDGNYIWIGHYTAGVLRYNKADLAGYVAYPVGSGSYYMMGASASPYHIIGTSFNATCKYVNKTTFAYGGVTGTIGAQGRPVFDGQYAWSPRYYYTYPDALYKISVSSTPAVVATVVLTGHSGVWLDIGYDPVHHCIWALSGTTMLQIDCATNAWIGTFPLTGVASAGGPGLQYYDGGMLWPSGDGKLNRFDTTSHAAAVYETISASAISVNMPMANVGSAYGWIVGLWGGTGFWRKQ